MLVLKPAKWISSNTCPQQAIHAHASIDQKKEERPGRSKAAVSPMPATRSHSAAVLAMNYPHLNKTPEPICSTHTTPSQPAEQNPFLLPSPPLLLSQYVQPPAYNLRGLRQMKEASGKGQAKHKPLRHAITRPDQRRHLEPRSSGGGHHGGRRGATRRTRRPPRRGDGECRPPNGGGCVRGSHPPQCAGCAAKRAVSIPVLRIGIVCGIFKFVSMICSMNDLNNLKIPTLCWIYRHNLGLVRFSRALASHETPGSLAATHRRVLLVVAGHPPTPLCLG